MFLDIHFVVHSFIVHSFIFIHAFFILIFDSCIHSGIDSQLVDSFIYPPIFSFTPIDSYSFIRHHSFIHSFAIIHPSIHPLTLSLIRFHLPLPPPPQVGEHLMTGLNGIAERRPGLLHRIRGLGTFVAFDLPSVGQRDKLLAILRSKGKRRRSSTGGGGGGGSCLLWPMLNHVGLLNSGDHLT